MSRESIKEIVWKTFTELTGVNGEEDFSLEVFSRKREAFVRRLRQQFPALRLRNSNGKVTVEDFVDALFAEQCYKDVFYWETLELVKRVSGHQEYTLQDRVFADLFPDETITATNVRQSQSVIFFLAFNKVLNALERKNNYYPAYSLAAGCKNIAELAELFYRRGQF